MFLCKEERGRHICVRPRKVKVVFGMVLFSRAFHCAWPYASRACSRWFCSLESPCCNFLPLWPYSGTGFIPVSGHPPFGRWRWKNRRLLSAKACASVNPLYTPRPCTRSTLFRGVCKTRPSGLSVSGTVKSWRFLSPVPGTTRGHQLACTNGEISSIFPLGISSPSPDSQASACCSRCFGAEKPQAGFRVRSSFLFFCDHLPVSVQIFFCADTGR